MQGEAKRASLTKLYRIQIPLVSFNISNLVGWHTPSSHNLTPNPNETNPLNPNPNPNPNYSPNHTASLPRANKENRARDANAKKRDTPCYRTLQQIDRPVAVETRVWGLLGVDQLACMGRIAPHRTARLSSFELASQALARFGWVLRVWVRVRVRVRVQVWNGMEW